MTTAAAAIAIVTAAAAKFNFPPSAFLVAAILIASTALKAEQSDGQSDGRHRSYNPPTAPRSDMYTHYVSCWKRDTRQGTLAFRD